jgi:hypothetical protein
MSSLPGEVDTLEVYKVGFSYSCRGFRIFPQKVSSFLANTPLVQSNSKET